MKATAAAKASPTKNSMSLLENRFNCLASGRDTGAGRRDIINRLPKRKKSALVSVSGRDRNFASLEGIVRRFLNWINASLDHTIYFAGGDRVGRGGVSDIAGLMDRAHRYGLILAGGEDE